MVQSGVGRSGAGSEGPVRGRKVRCGVGPSDPTQFLRAEFREPSHLVPGCRTPPGPFALSHRTVALSHAARTFALSHRTVALSHRTVALPHATPSHRTTAATDPQGEDTFLLSSIIWSGYESEST